MEKDEAKESAVQGEPWEGLYAPTKRESNPPPGLPTVGA